MGSRVCTVHIFTGLLYLFSQPILGDGTEINIAGGRYRRDAEDQYYDPSTRMGCPPSMVSAGGSGPVKFLIFVVDTTLSNGKEFNEYVNLLLKIRNYAKDAYVGAVSLNCHSEAILRFGRHNDEAIRKAILAQKPKSGKKTISEAFNLADILIASSVPDRRSVRVVVLSDTVTDDCLDVKHPIDAFTIASKNWRSSGVKILFLSTGRRTEEMDSIAGEPDSVISLKNSARVAEGYRKVAKWICVDESKGGSHGGPSGDVTSRSSNSDARQSSSSSKSSTTQSSSSSTPPTTSSTSSSTSRSTPSENKQAQMPYVPGAGTDVALLFVIDFTKSSEKLFNAVIDYVVRISDYVPKARIGIVMISCPSKTLLEIGIYSGPEIRSNVIAPTEPLKEKGTAQALEIGKKLLESVNRKHKFVFLMSDGGKSTCLKEKPKEDEIKIAEIIRNLGIKILYSIVGDNPDKDTIDKITGDSKLCINLGDLIKLLEELKKSHEQFDKTSSTTSSSSAITTTTTTTPTTTTTTTPTTTTTTTPTTITTATTTSATTTTSSTTSSSTAKSTARRSTSTLAASRTEVVNLPTIPRSGADVSVVFIVDFTKSCGDQFAAALDNVATIANSMEEARIGVVSIGCPSETLLEMGTYTEHQIRKLSPPENPSDRKGTAQAFYLAEELLAKEKRRYKFLIVLSDGEETTCTKDEQKDNEIIIAVKLRGMGITIFYIAVIPIPKKNEIEKITGDRLLIFNLVDLSELLKMLVKCLNKKPMRPKPSRSCKVTNSKAVLFILDQTSTVGEGGLSEEKQFILGLLSIATDLRAGAVVIACPSYEGLPMKDYTTEEVKKWAEERKMVVKPHLNQMFTATYDAYKLGQDMLDGDDAESKVVVVLSDGQTSNCKDGKEVGEYGYSDVRTREFEIARKWRESGVRIIYVEVGDRDWIYKDNVNEIVGMDKNNILSVDDYTKLDKNVIINVVKKICSWEEF